MLSPREEALELDRDLLDVKGTELRLARDGCKRSKAELTSIAADFWPAK